MGVTPPCSYAVPGAILNLMVVARFTSIVLTWSPPQDPNGVIIAYQITYQVNDNLTTINTTDISTMLSIELALNITVSDISLRAYTSVGPGNAVMHRDVSTPPIPIPREYYFSMLWCC